MKVKAQRKLVKSATRENKAIWKSNRKRVENNNQIQRNRRKNQVNEGIKWCPLDMPK